MVSKVRTIDFLPDIFRTKTNEQFLSASLDQLVQQPDYTRMQGFIGAKFGYGVSSSDTYITEPSTIRSEYQLEPAVVFTKPESQTPRDALTYPGLLEALKLQGSPTTNHNSLFNDEFYSWDSFCDLDKFVNYNNYYWLPNGPDAVTLTSDNYVENASYGVISGNNVYKFTQNEVNDDTSNPTLTLVRGSRYAFIVDQKTPFYIQTMPGVSGVNPAAKNLSTREIYGLQNNGMSYGAVIFDVPLKTAQNEFLYPDGLTVDIATTLNWDDINGKILADVSGIDGVADIIGKTIIFYGQPEYAAGYIGGMYDSSPYSTTSFEDGYYTNLNSWSYRVTIVGSGSDSIIKLVEDTVLPSESAIVIKSGATYCKRKFVRNTLREIELLPYITANVDTLYYQDGVNPDKVGTIKLVDSIDRTIDISEILGKTSYQSPNGIALTNGLKVQFAGKVTPEEYKYQQYYVEGVGTSINLLPITDFIVTEPFSTVIQMPYDIKPYDISGYGEALYTPEYPDYITINRNSVNRNAWSRSNCWFHEDVIKLSIANNDISPLSTAAFENNTRARRPIIEFYPNLKLFNSGTVAKAPVDYINFTATDAFNQCNGQTVFSPDGASSLIFDGCRIIFANDSSLAVRSKIYVATYIEKTPGSPPIISLSEAYDSQVEYQDQLLITKGENYIGHTFWFDGSNWVDGQFKETVNQPPRFDVFDNNGISFGDRDFYGSSDFDGCTLFEYTPTVGVDDPILGFPVKYSSVNNIGDISFNVSLNSQTFNYVENSLSKVGIVSDGYVFNYSDRTTYTREIGWQTAVENSFQYQVFSFVYSGIPSTPTFKCDVPAISDADTAWQSIVVYVNNQRTADYSYTTDTISTTIVFNNKIDVGVPVTVMVYSNTPSKTAYYQIPTNLEHNPFNEEITNINFGDVRSHYKSICNNLTSLKGIAFGANNYRDLGNVVPYGTKVIQNASSVVPAALFLRNKDANLLDALSFNATEYVKFKNLLVDTIDRSDFNPTFDDAYILDSALSEIARAKSESNSFFWSDMIPSKNPTVVNTYTFNVGINASSFPLSREYSFTEANYSSVLVYVTRKVNNIIRTTQLVRGVDYDIAPNSSEVSVLFDLIQNDILTVKEYHQTYGSFIPNTPTKVGLYPKTIPEVVYDTTYITPTYFIKGHDGSYTKLFGSYTNGYLEDFRDRALLEFETRIYNNIKVDAQIPVTFADIFPGEFRTTDYTASELQPIYDSCFLNWIGINRIDYKTQKFVSTDDLSWNYTGSTTALNKKVTQGNWRGLYMWYYDTSTPNLTPWEMLGLSTKPLWWESRYGVAPYTSDNTLLWQDLRDGFVYNGGDSYVDEKYTRPDLLKIIPVDEIGNLKTPIESLVKVYNVSSLVGDWETGDLGPAEYSYRKSSSWPFDLMRIMALVKPARFFTMGIDLDLYRFNSEFNQYLVNDRTRNLFVPKNLNIYGTDQTTAEHSYINWVVDYLNQFGLNGSTFIRDMFLNVDVRLSYRLAGFSDKDMLRFMVEKGSTDNLTTSLMIPDESYSVLMYENEPSEIIAFTSVIVQKTLYGYKVYGNSQTKAYFNIIQPIINGNLSPVTVNNLTVKLYKDFSSNEQIIPYGTEFKTVEALSNFLISYGQYLTKQGMQFNDIENGLELTWQQMVAETMYWAQSGWEVGSTINVNPCANQISIDRDSMIVQPLTLASQNYVLNQNLIPIQLKDLSVYRNNTLFNVKALNAGDSISFLNAKLSNVEHIVIFDNTTSFNDLVYNPVTALRQQRLYVKGTKTAEWNGTMNAAGFIINQNNVQEWVSNQKYTKGIIVKYKNKYWMSQSIIAPSETFDTTKWIQTDYDKISTGLLPNASTRALESTMYYDTNRANLENDGDLLSYSLIGYRPRQYLVNADLDDVAQVNVYKNMLSVKGTNLAVNGLDELKVQHNTLSYDVYENWAVKTSEFGGILNQNFVEFTLNKTDLVGNPAITSLVVDQYVPNSQQQVPLHNLKNYGRQISNPDILSTVDSFEEKLPNAGYVNLDDVYATGYSIERLDDTIINSVYKGDYIWIADNLNTWNVYSMNSMENSVTQVSNNLDGTATFTFSKPHGLTQYDSIGVLNFNESVNGYFEIDSIKDLTNVIVLANLPSTISTMVGTGLAFKLQYQRVGTARDIDLLPALDHEFLPYKVWVDKNTQGNWTVYERKNRYTDSNFTKTVAGFDYGRATCYVEGVGYFVADPEVNKLYQYRKDKNRFNLFKTYEPSGPVTGFGTTIVQSNDFLIVSASNPNAYGTTNKSYFYVYKITRDENLPVLTLDQVEEIGGSRFGDAMALSGDGNYLYGNLLDYGLVIAYQQDVDYRYESIPTSLSTVMTLAASTVINSTSFIVSGNRVNYIDEGKYVCFNNAGNETVYTVITGEYEGMLTDVFTADGTTTKFTARQIKTQNVNRTNSNTTVKIDNVTQSTATYTIAGNDILFVSPPANNSSVEIITTIDKTTFYTVERIQHTYATGSTVYTASYNFSVIMVYVALGQPITTDVLADPAGISYGPGNRYGYSLATNYDGTKLFVGAPKWNYNDNTQDVGTVWVYDRVVTNVEVKYNIIPGSTYLIFLSYLVDPGARIYINNRLLSAGDYLLVANRVGIVADLLKAGDIVTVSTGRFVLTEQLVNYKNASDVIPGEEYGYSLSSNKDASELLVGSPYNIHFADTQGAVYRYTNGDKRFGIKTGSVATNITTPTYFYVNGYVVNAFNDITFSSSVVMKNSNDPTGASTSVTVSVADAAKMPSYGVISFYDTVSIPNAVRSIAYSSVNKVTGVVTFAVPFVSSQSSHTFTAPGSYLSVPLGAAQNVADAINLANITNIFAYATDDHRLVIRLRDMDLNPVNNKLNVTTLLGSDLFELGFRTTYTQTQAITNPHPEKTSLFGYAVKFNEYNSFVISAPLGSRYINTTFDFSNDNNAHNDTVFDNGFTRWIDNTKSAGAVYMYDYIDTYNESLTTSNIGKFLYAQSINDKVDTDGTMPMYGSSLSYNGYVVMVGAPDFYVNNVSGRVVVYENSEYTQSWSVYREYSKVVDINKIQKVQLYDNETNENLSSLDYFDPLAGKLLGAVAENIDYISGVDPAGYSNPSIAAGNTVWTNDHVGNIWFDTSTTRFINYHQNDVVYDSRYWGAIFPGSEVAIYTWIKSSVPPASYSGTGVVYDAQRYSVSFGVDANGLIAPEYYFWVRETNVLYSEQGKTLTDFVIKTYITNPQSSGIAYFAPLSARSFGLYNVSDDINGTSTNIHIGYSSSNSDANKHAEYKLIRTNHPTDFLPGLPNSVLGTTTPTGIYDRLLDSLSGTDELGAVVPDPYLPKLLQVGINARPRQSLFSDRFGALRNYFEFVNKVIALYPISENGNATYLSANGEFYNTMSYWSYVYWWAEGYSTATRTSLEVPTYNDLSTIIPTAGMVVGVAKNGNGKREVYTYQNSEWIRIGLEDGTIEFSNKLWDYELNRYGYGDNYFDTVPFDEYPSIETRYIVRALTEQIFVGELLKYRNESLVLLFDFIQSENNDASMSWLNKTSLVDVNYLVRELVQYDKYRDDNTELISGYVNEVKPYRVVIKEFTTSYSGSEVYTAGYTDFDLPAKYNTAVEKFISPQLVKSMPNDVSTFNASSDIWTNTDYTSWFNHHGVQLEGSLDTVVCITTKYITNNDTKLYVDNAKGIPNLGQFTLGSEIIGYSNVDRERGILLGLSRGLYNTTPSACLPGTSVHMDLPGVIVLDSGRRYVAAPAITAVVDTTLYPAPRRPAKLKAIMGENRVIGVQIIDPGSGYVTQPEIVIDFAYYVSATSSAFNFTFNTITISDATFNDGDLVKFESSGPNSILVPGYYYVHVIDPVNSVMSLHNTKTNALTDTHRVKFYSANSTVNNTYKIGICALAVPNLSGNKVRALLETIRFDRTSYEPKIVEWTPGTFWSSPYVSIGNDASSVELLYDSLPYQIDIDDAWVSPLGGTGAIFDVYNVLFGREYDAEVALVNDAAGTNYTVGDVITIPGTSLDGTTPVNDCYITVDTVGSTGDILTFTVSGIAVDSGDASLQGAVMPVVSVDSNPSDNLALVTLSTVASGIKVGQIQGSKIYFYNAPIPYYYGRNFEGSISGTTLTVTTWYSGTIQVGSVIYGEGIASGTTVTGLGTGTGDVGTYTIDISQEVVTTPMNLGGDAILEISKPRFDIGKLSNQYSVRVVFGGVIYTDNSTIDIPGSLVGGIDDVNDVIITIKYANVDGSIYIISNVDGVCSNDFASFYVEPIVQRPTQGVIKLYENPNLTSPVGYNSVYLGYDYAYIPEPMVAGLSYKFDTSSIVSYQGKVWRCIDSNNDRTFDLTKWVQVESDDRSLNALDRIAAFYQPTIGMIGKNYSQLLDGVSYPNTVYQGNEFPPLGNSLLDRFPVDIELRDLPYIISGLTLKDMLYDGQKYIGIADGPNYSVVLTSSDFGVTWESHPISQAPLGVTSISYTTEHYVITTRNTPTPVLLSYDGYSWVTTGEYTPFDATPFDVAYYDTGALSAPAIGMNGSAFYNGMSVIVGDDNVSISDTYADWSIVYTNPSRLVNIMNAVEHVSMKHFVGYVVVGRTDVIVSGEGTAAPDIRPYSMILTSIDGQTWIPRIPHISETILNGIAYNNNLIVVVGDDSEIWYSTNSSNWTKATFTATPTTVSIKSVAYGNGKFVAVGADGFIATSSNGISFTQITGVLSSDLYNIFFDTGTSRFIAVGDNDTIIRSANGTSWGSISYKTQRASDYEIVSSDYEFGYGPEELVAGVVTDTMSMKVTTTPGSYWDNDSFTQDYWYYNTGFNMVSNVLTPDANNSVSFDGFVRNPASLSVFIIDTLTNYSTRIYELSSVNNPVSYSVNWITNTVTLNQSLSSNQQLLVEVYDIGNGRQLISGNSKDYPITVDPVTGNSMFVTDVTYQVLVTDPIIYVNGNKLEYNTDYTVTYNDDDNFVILFSTLYDTDVDYIVGAILGNTVTDYGTTQYGYSIMDTELFVGNGSLYTTTLDLSGDNPENLIVELNGIRLVPEPTIGYDYTVNALTGEIDLTPGGLVLSSNDILAVTTFNETGRLWLRTEFAQTLTVSAITYVYNTTVAKISVNFIDALNAFVDGDLVRIDGVNGTDELNGNTYYVRETINSATSSNLKFYELFKDSGLKKPVDGSLMSLYLSEGYVWLDQYTLQITSPAVPVPMPDIEYHDGHRTWTTLDGYRVDPSKIIFREDNKMSICVPMSAGTNYILTTVLCDGNTPEEETFTLNVNKTGETSVYRTNITDGTWLTSDMTTISTSINVKDVTRLVKVQTTTSTAVTVDSQVIVYLTDVQRASEVKQVNVYNNTTFETVSLANISQSIVNGKNALVFSSSVADADILEVTVYLGDLIKIGPETIYFASIDIENNTISGLIRGVNGTPAIAHTTYEMCYGINDYVKLYSAANNTLWNSFDINVHGDPLQLSTTPAAIFLKG